jgi:hypothetical protein
MCQLHCLPGTAARFWAVQALCNDAAINLSQLISDSVCLGLCAAHAVMVVCITVNMLRIYSSFELDHHRFALTLYRTSQFVLALLLAFRLVSIKH